MLLGVDIGPEVECCKVSLVDMEYLTIFGERIVPLLQVDVCLCLAQTEVNISWGTAQMLAEHLERVAPLLTGLRLGGGRGQ